MRANGHNLPIMRSY